MLGVPHEAESLQVRYVVLANRLSLTLLFFALASALSYYPQNTPSLSAILSSAFFVLTPAATLWLNARTHFKAARAFLMFGSSFILLSSLASPIESLSHFLGYAIGGMGLGVLPPLLFDAHKERGLLVASIAYFVVLGVGLDLYILESGQIDGALLDGKYWVLIKVPLLIGWVLYTVGVLFLKRANTTLYNEVHEKNLRIQQQSQEIQQQNQELREANTAIAQQLKELTEQRSNITSQQAELSQSEKRLRNFLNGIPAGVYVIAANGTPHFMNEVGRAMLTENGVEHDPEIDPRALVEQVRHGTDLAYPFDRQPLMRALIEGISTSVEDVDFKVGKQRIPMEVSASPIYNTEQDIEFAISVFQDITERRKREAALEEVRHELAKKEAEARSVLSAIAENYLLVEFNAHGKVINVNERACAFFKTSKESMLGRSHEEVFQYSSKGLSANQLVQQWAHMLEEGAKTSRLQLAQHEQVFWLRATFMPIPNEYGQVLRILVMAQDITQNMNQQKEIENVNSLLEEKVEHIEQQNLLLLEQQKEIAQKNALLQQREKALQQQNNEQATTLHKLKDTQSQLVHSEKMVALGQLTAGIAHELNNPINYINSGIDGIQQATEVLLQLMEKYRTLTPENAAEQVPQIEEFEKRVRFDRLMELLHKMPENIGFGARRAAEIVRELRTFSRLNEDELKLANVHEGINSTLVLLHNQYKRDIQIIKDYNDYMPNIECYPGKLNQVFMNLLNNAIQAIREKQELVPQPIKGAPLGTVTISTRKVEEGESETIQVTVSDTGVGIKEGVRNRIFEPFFTTKDVGKGTGLGLSISASIVSDHHGHISVESTPGEGTSFIVKLPVRQTQKAQALQAT